MSVILNGTTQYLWSNVVVGSDTDIADYPFTISAWVKPADLTTANPVASAELLDGTEINWLMCHGLLEGDPVVVRTLQGGSYKTATTADDYVTGSWQHVCAVFTSAVSRTVYLDGGSKNTNTDNKPAPPDSADWAFVVGAYSLAGGANAFFNGRIAQVTIWDIALSDADVALLASGSLPTTIQADNVQGSWPLLANANAAVGGDNLTGVGEPTYDAEDSPPVAEVTYVDASGTIAGVSALSGAASVLTFLAVSDTLAGVSALSGAVATSHSTTGIQNTSGRMKKRLVAINNNCLYYEDVD